MKDGLVYPGRRSATLSDIPWATYQPTYVGAPVEELSKSLFAMDAKHWANQREITQLEMAMSDMQFPEADKAKMADVIGQVQGRIGELSNQPSLARSGNELNNIMKSVVMNPAIKGSLKNKMYIDAKKNEIQQLYLTGKYSADQRDRYLKEVEEQYAQQGGVQVDEHGMYTPYTYNNRPHFFDFDKFRVDQRGNFSGDTIENTKTRNVERIEYDENGKAIRKIGEQVTTGYQTTPGDDFEVYYRDVLENNPDAMAYIEERSRLEGISKDDIFNEEVALARQAYQKENRIQKVVETDRQNIRDAREDTKMILSQAMARANTMTDITSYDKGVSKANELDADLNAAVGDKGYFYDYLSRSGVVPPAKLTSIKSMIEQKIKSGDPITPYDFKGILGDNYSGLIDGLSNYTVHIENIRSNQRVVASMMETVTRSVLDSYGHSGDLDSFLAKPENNRYLKQIDNLKAQVDRYFPKDAPDDYEIQLGPNGPTTTKREFVERIERDVAEVVNKVPALVEINNRLKEYAAPFTGAISIHDFGINEDAIKLKENATKFILQGLDDLGKMDMRFLDRPDQLVSTTERKKYTNPNEKTEVYWLAEKDGRIGLAFRVEDKEIPGKGEWMVTYAFSEPMRNNLTSTGVILDSDLNFMSMVNQVTQTTGEGEIPVIVNGKKEATIGIRTLSKAAKDAPFVGKGAYFEMRFPDGKGGMIPKYPKDHFEAHDMYNNYLKSIGYLSDGSPQSNPDVVAKLPTDIKEDVEFTSGVSRLAAKYKIPEEYLYAVMHFETGGTFDPKEKNKAGSGATGLIQFMPSTVQDMFGMDIKEFEQMDRNEQLKYVERYFDYNGLDQLDNIGIDDLYMSILYPAAIGKPAGHILFRRGTKAYEQNKGLDKSGKGYITKADAVAKVEPFVQTYKS